MEKEEINFGSSVDELLKGLEGFVRRVLISETMLAIPIEEVMRFGSPMLSPLE